VCLCVFMCVYVYLCVSMRVYVCLCVFMCVYVCISEMIHGEQSGICFVSCVLII